MDCGPTCLKMVGKFYGRTLNINKLREKSYITKNGVSMLGISDAADAVGFHSVGVKITIEQLTNDVKLPCIVHWKKDHFVVVYKTSKRKGNLWIHVADPAVGKIKLKSSEFENGWISTKTNGQKKGHCLILEPTETFYQDEDEKNKSGSLTRFIYFAKKYKALLFHLILGFILTSIFSLTLPILAQALVDIGINGKSESLLIIILVGQLFLTLGIASVGFIRGWIMLQLTNRINISLITTFLSKLMNLPLSFFDSKRTGDLMQRINDNGRVQTFLTSTLINFFFSVVNIFALSAVVAYYNKIIFLVFVLGSIIYVLWIKLFLKYRRELDYRRFTYQSNNQSTLIQLINGMQDIKLFNSEKQKRWQWESVQALLFKVSNKSLVLNQYQNSGAILINGMKNLFISYLAAKYVMDGKMSLGMMVAVQYIIGQLSGPIDSLVDFFQSHQDAKISLERLNEIQDLEPENASDNLARIIPDHSNITIENFTFHYNGPRSPAALSDINLTINANQITAIVGSSGSGKTTLLKALMGIYPPQTGDIKVGNISLDNIHTNTWRDCIGVVMQDGYIFSESIINNITLGNSNYDMQKVAYAVEMANIGDFIEALPSGYNTVIGNEGNGLSQGQKQRILIARAIYKDPDFIFFDEATNALDAKNEKIIIENLNKFFNGKTVVIVAHRLSTVRHADNIIVMENGKVMEMGNHETLVSNRSYYYDLISNQLELAK